MALVLPFWGVAFFCAMFCLSPYVYSSRWTDICPPIGHTNAYTQLLYHKLSYFSRIFLVFLQGVCQSMRIEKRFFLIPLAGLGSGLVNGLLGAGGGILLVLSMQALWQDTPQDVLANALCVTLPTTAVSCLLYLKNGSLPTEGFAPFILPALLGG
ncbi:MAG: hypothetical protein E7664_06475, partial [Ruminococcaceae bacterium]|nr:hypothetical protein [Oscillospiraceae bacterium]